jgi:hypothetical protein
MSRSWRVVLSIASRLAAVGRLDDHPPVPAAGGRRHGGGPTGVRLEPGGVARQPGRVLALVEAVGGDVVGDLPVRAASLDQIGTGRPGSPPASRPRPGPEPVVVAEAVGHLGELVVEPAHQVAVQGGRAGQPDQQQGDGDQDQHGRDQLDLQRGPGGQAPAGGQRPQGHGSGSRRT